MVLDAAPYSLAAWLQRKTYVFALRADNCFACHYDVMQAS
jgi:hypothetical protein